MILASLSCRNRWTPWKPQE